MLPGSLNLGLARGHGGSALGEMALDHFLRSKSRASLIGSNHLGGGLVVGCCKKKKGSITKNPKPRILGRQKT